MAKKKTSKAIEDDSGEERKSFADVLDMAADEATRPLPLPVGHYTLLVGEQSFTKAQNEEQTDMCRYTLKPVDVGADVDEEELFEGWKRRTLRSDFFLTEESVWRLKEFLEKCGVDTEGRTFSELIGEAIGQHVIGYVDQEPSKKPGSDEIYNRVTRFVDEEE